MSIGILLADDHELVRDSLAAFLHSAVMQERRGMFKVWNMVLVILAFVLCIFATRPISRLTWLPISMLALNVALCDRS